MVARKNSCSLKKQKQTNYSWLPQSKKLFQGRPAKPFHSMKMQITGAASTVMQRRQLNIIMLSDSVCTFFKTSGRNPELERMCLFGGMGWGVGGTSYQGINRRVWVYPRQISMTSQFYNFSSGKICLFLYLFRKNPHNCGANVHYAHSR